MAHVKPMLLLLIVAGLKVADSARPLPVFRMDNFTSDEQFESLWSMAPRCSHTEYATPIDSMCTFECVDATPVDVSSFAQTFASMNLSKPVKFRLENTPWNAPLQPFQPIAELIIMLDLHLFNPLPASFIRSLRLPNLLHFSVQMCTGINLEAGAFLNMPQLRIIEFAIVNTFTSISEHFHRGLTELSLLTLESDYEDFRDSETLTADGKMVFDLRPNAVDVGDRMPFVRELHCKCQYRWLRSLYQRQPQLIQAKKYKDIFAYGDTGSYTIKSQNIFIPVDCRKSGKNAVLKDFKSYSLNVPASCTKTRKQ